MLSISIALTTYNGEKYLQAQLDSFVAQTIQPSELIICDDGSTDNTLNILEVFKAQASFSVLIYKNVENLGYAQNFSKALSLCSGDIVFLSDQDDVWHTNKIEAMLAMFEANPKVQLLIHDLAFCNAVLEPTGETKLMRFSGAKNRCNDYVTGMATAVRRSFLRLCLPIPQSAITHDVWLHNCAQSLGLKKVMTEVLAQYRRHEANATIKSKINSIHNNYKRFIPINNFTKLEKSGLCIALERHRLLKNWIEVNSHQLIVNNLATQEYLNGFLQAHFLEMNFISARISILKRSKINRFLPVSVLYFKGGYKLFNGFKSAVKDILIN
jgi:glycosyltransferase involved in cell wall biosynthesis